MEKNKSLREKIYDGYYTNKLPKRMVTMSEKQFIEKYINNHRWLHPILLDEQYFYLMRKPLTKIENIITELKLEAKTEYEKLKQMDKESWSTRKAVWDEFYNDLIADYRCDDTELTKKIYDEALEGINSLFNKLERVGEDDFKTITNNFGEIYSYLKHLGLNAGLRNG